MKKHIFYIFLILTLIVMPKEYHGAGDTASVEGQLPRLSDGANLLSGSQIVELTDLLDEISERYNFDVRIVTVNSIEGYDSFKYADDLYDDGGFGMGAQQDGILFLLNMKERDWAISTHGFGITAFTDAGQNHIMKEVLSHLKKDEYYRAFKAFAGFTDDFIGRAKSGKPYDAKTLPKPKIWIVYSLAGGALFSLIIMGGLKNQLKSVSKQKIATKYLTNAVMAPGSSKDLFLYSVVEKRPIPTSSQQAKGGSSTRRSSGGKTHGGSSGKF